MNNIKVILQRKGMTQRELHVRTGVNLTTISQIATGEQDILRSKFGTVIKLCSGLECLPHELVPEEFVNVQSSSDKKIIEAINNLAEITEVIERYIQPVQKDGDKIKSARHGIAELLI